ncbi:hypothetical protein [Rhodosalinus sp.]|uniref:hypothetical protein n=1 Tax=Rhodosalinus sp. TaxID=2047741 RepID=UPI0039793D84
MDFWEEDVNRRRASGFNLRSIKIQRLFQALEGALWGGAVISPLKLDPAEAGDRVQASSGGEALQFNRRIFWISVSTI